MTSSTVARRRSRPALWTAGAVAVVLALLIGVLATRSPATDRLVRSPLVGKVAPSFEAATLGGDAFSLEEHRGEFVLVNFFATWCVPCQREHDDLKRFAEERGGDWPVLRDDDGAIATAWGVARVPESYLVAPSGVVVGKVTGGVSFDFLQRQLARLQAGR